MRESLAIIERVRRIGDGWQQVSLAVEDAALEQLKPGQSLLVKDHDTWDPYLRQSWVPIDYDSGMGVLEIERPESEQYEPGNIVSAIGPIGTEFPVHERTRHILLVALDYPPTRLRFLLMSALRSDRAVTLVLAGMTQPYPVNALPPETEVIYSDHPLDWPSFKDTIVWADQIFAITGTPFIESRYSALKEKAEGVRQALPAEFLFGVYDLPLPCGTGSCMACMIGNQFCCIDGPAVDLGKVRY